MAARAAPINDPYIRVSHPVSALLELQKEFPGFVIWREITGDRARYVAKRTRSDLSPHTAICTTMAELRAVLSGSHGHGSVAAGA